MNKKRNILIICIVVALVVVIGIAGVLYFILTNTKSKKEVFVGKIIEFMSENQEEGNALNEYLKKKKTMPYENEGNISIEGSSNNENSQMPKIVFSGKSNPLERQAEQNIEIQYSDEVKFPISYRQDNDIFGLQTKYLSNSYIAVENNNLKEFVEKLGMDATQIPDKIELPEADEQQIFSDEELEQLKDKYSVVLDNIKEEQITVTKENEQENYELMLDSQTTKDILVQAMDILKNDDIILDKINSLATENNGQINELISELADQLRELDVEEIGNTKIIIVSENGKATKLSIVLSNDERQENVVDITKTENEVKYQFGLWISNLKPNYTSIDESEDTKIHIGLDINFSGINQEENINEEYTVTADVYGEDLTTPNFQLRADFTNTINFTNDVQIEKLTNQNTMLFNNYSQEQLAVLLPAMGNRLTEVYESQMEQLGVGENANPFTSILAGALINNAAKETMTNTDTNATDTNNNIEENEEQEETNNKQNNTEQETSNNMLNSMGKAEIQTFNSRFEKYKGTVRGTMVKSLLQDIQTSNASDMDNQVKIEGIISSIMEVSSIQASQKYEVSLSYDNNGRVNSVKIENASN